MYPSHPWFVYDNPMLEYKLRFVVLLLILALWSIPWKGVALWKAARNSDKFWFVILFVCNTLGVLEILYVYVFSKKKLK